MSFEFVVPVVVAVYTGTIAALSEFFGVHLKARPRVYRKREMTLSDYILVGCAVIPALLTITVLILCAFDII